MIEYLLTGLVLIALIKLTEYLYNKLIGEVQAGKVKPDEPLSVVYYYTLTGTDLALKSLGIVLFMFMFKEIYTI